MDRVPRVRFYVNKRVNLFYHVCVLFSEYFPDEYAGGILNNAGYHRQYEHLRTQPLHKKFQHLWEHSFYTWDFIGKSLKGGKNAVSIRNVLRDASQEQMDVWSDILLMVLPQYEDIWANTEAKLEDYRLKFGAEWESISNSVLTKMSNLAKSRWKTDSIDAHLVDCVHGAQSWSKDVVLPPFPVFDVERKLLAHELAHILVPDYFLKTELARLGLDSAIAHTVVDFIAYFSVRDYVKDAERRGIKPNPDYYVKVPEIHSIFEECYKHPDRYQNLGQVLQQIKS